MNDEELQAEMEGSLVKAYAEFINQRDDRGIGEFGAFQAGAIKHANWVIVRIRDAHRLDAAVAARKHKPLFRLAGFWKRVWSR